MKMRTIRNNEFATICYSLGYAKGAEFDYHTHPCRMRQDRFQFDINKV